MRSPLDGFQISRPFGRGGVAFTPASLALDGWWDASQGYTGISSNVTALPDLTGNGNALTYYSDTTAATIAQLNGIDVVQLPATDDDQSFYNVALGASVSQNNTAPFTIAGTVRYTDISVDRTPWGTDNTASAFDGLQYDHRGTGSANVTRFTARPPSGGATTINLGHMSAANTTFTYVHVFDGAGKVKVWVNGAYEGEVAFAPTGTFGTANSLSFGGMRLSGNAASGDVIGVLGEMCFKAAALSDADAAALAGYLNGKYT